MGESLAKYPSNVYLALAVIPVVVISVCLGLNLYDHHYATKFVPLPSNSLSGPIERYVSGWAAVVIAPLIFTTAFRSYKAFTKSRTTSKNIVVVALCYAIPFIGVAIGISYSAMCFWTLSDAVWIHLGIHAATLVLLLAYFALHDVLIKLTKHKLPMVSVIYDGITAIVLSFYLLVGYYALTKSGAANQELLLSAVSISGYLVWILLFVRFPILNSELSIKPPTASKKHH